MGFENWRILEGAILEGRHRRRCDVAVAVADDGAWRRMELSQLGCVDGQIVVRKVCLVEIEVVAGGGSNAVVVVREAIH